MPIIRRDDTADPLDQYIVIIWKSRWIIAAVAVITAILVYIALLFVHSSYKVESQIYVNQLSSLENGETPSPDTVASLLKSQSVLKKVRTDFVKKYNVERAPDIEKFVKQFDVKSDILQDTTVRKEYSPVLTLEVEAEGAEQTRFIMESWVRNFISDFGNYTAQEAVIKRESFLAEKAELEKKIEEMTRRFSESQAKLPFYKKVLAEKLDLLSPSRLRISEDTQSEQIDLNLNFHSARMSAGLLERHAELILEMHSGTAPTTAAVELSALTTAINDAHTSIAQAQKDLADELTEQNFSKHQLELLVQNQGSLNEALARFIVASAGYKPVNLEGLPAGGDIRALTLPITPEARVWPKRTSTAAIAAVAAAIIAIFVILGSHFLSRVLKTSTQ